VSSVSLRSPKTTKSRLHATRAASPGQPKDGKRRGKNGVSTSGWVRYIVGAPSAQRTVEVSLVHVEPCYLSDDVSWNCREYVQDFFEHSYNVSEWLTDVALENAREALGEGYDEEIVRAVAASCEMEETHSIENVYSHDGSFCFVGFDLDLSFKIDGQVYGLVTLRHKDRPVGWALDVDFFAEVGDGRVLRKFCRLLPDPNQRVLSYVRLLEREYVHDCVRTFNRNTNDAVDELRRYSGLQRRRKDRIR
jgi:hypothetical protein